MKTTLDSNLENRRQKTIAAIKWFAFLATLILPALALASVEGSLANVQSTLVDRILPLAATCGLVIAGISFTFGHQNARRHLVFAIIGAVVGFGAESIMHFIQMLVH